MTTATIICLYFSAISVFAGGYLFLSYGEYAINHRWPVGALFDSGKLALPGIFFMLLAIAFPVYHHSWLALLIIPILGFSFSFILTQVFKFLVQPLSPILILLGTGSYFLCLCFVR